MRACEVPGCCSLKVTYDLDCLGQKDAFSKKEAAKWDKLRTRRRLGEGQVGIFAGIAIVSEECDIEGGFCCTQQRAFLVDKGYKMLGKYKVDSCGSSYFVYIYGSKEIIL